MTGHLLRIVFLLSFALPFSVHAQNNQSGFISIDCGLVDEQNYTDETTSIYYTWDVNFTDTGISHSISSKHKASLERQFWNVRSFPEGTRNCYTLFVSQGSSKKYLVRASFVYGNYDGKDSHPEFDIYLGAKWWESVVFENSSSVITKEIIYTASSDYVHVCLFNTGKGTPFISVLELRVLKSDAYLFNSLELLARFDVGSQDGKKIRLSWRSYGNKFKTAFGHVKNCFYKLSKQFHKHLHFFLFQRYPDDIYDRAWTSYNSIDWKKIDTSLTIDKRAPPLSFLMAPPSTVMRTTAIPANASESMKFHFLPKYNASRYYVYLYFNEIQKFQANQIREFNIFLNGELLNSDPLNPVYLENVYYISVVSETKLELWFNKTSRSTLPPLFNAVEIYMAKDFLQSETYQTDVDAILNVKSIYGIKRNWQGDPCTPVSYLWNGLNCSYVGTDSPRIIYLNLTSSSLIGTIASGISHLKSIEYLDLSNNNLTGAVPDFLSQLRFLRVLNLEGNQLAGSIPVQLLVHSENSMLKSNFGRNPNLCTSGSCNKRNGTKVLVPLVASIGGAFIILAVAMISFRIYYKRHQVSHNLSKLGAYSRIKQELESKKQEFSYKEVLSITRNFEKVVGKGASGTVYHGWIDHDTEVAVKMLSSSSAQGYLQFQAEAKLFAVVHHKYLTGLIGYCDDGTNMALIYEYMSNGDLAKHLSDKNENILSWNQRLQIAVDAAEGLEYLHHGCIPPIVHRDVKSKNILLNDKLQGKLADFGLSKIFPNEDDTHVCTVVAGTPGYLDPEYNRLSRLREKSDVFSFGVVLLEIITGQPAISKTEEKIHIVQLVGSMLLERDVKDIVDPRLQGEFDIYSAKKALDTAMTCVAPKSINRPTMRNVVKELKQCLENKITHSSDSSFSSFIPEISPSTLNSVSFDRISGESSLAR